MAQPDKTLVELYIYDLAQGMASHFSGLVGFALEGIWHTSIVVFGHEWFFGSGGIEQCPPGSTMLGNTRIQMNLEDKLGQSLSWSCRSTIAEGDHGRDVCRVPHVHATPGRSQPDPLRPHQLQAT